MDRDPALGGEAVQTVTGVLGREDQALAEAPLLVAVGYDGAAAVIEELVLQRG